MFIELFYVSVHESRAPERAQGFGPRLGLAGWSFFVTLLELRKVRPHRVFLGRRCSVPAGKIYTDLTSAVSGSAIADGVGAGLLKPFFLVLYSYVRKLRQKSFFAGPICFQQPCGRVVSQADGGPVAV